MDAEFVEFLDKKFLGMEEKFQTLEKNVHTEIQSVRTELKGEITGIKRDIAELRGSLETLTRAVDRFVKLHEDVIMEQTMLRVDIDRIKVVLKEKLGVAL